MEQVGEDATTALPVLVTDFSLNYYCIILLPYEFLIPTLSLDSLFNHHDFFVCLNLTVVNNDEILAYSILVHFGARQLKCHVSAIKFIFCCTR